MDLLPDCFSRNTLFRSTSSRSSHSSSQHNTTNHRYNTTQPIIVTTQHNQSSSSSHYHPIIIIIISSSSSHHHLITTTSQTVNGGASFTVESTVTNPSLPSSSPVSLYSVAMYRGVYNQVGSNPALSCPSHPVLSCLPPLSCHLCIPSSDLMYPHVACITITINPNQQPHSGGLTPVVSGRGGHCRRQRRLHLSEDLRPHHRALAAPDPRTHQTGTNQPAHR